MRLHVEALFTHDDAGQLLRVNEPNGARAPRFFLGHTRDGPLWRFRDDVGSDTRREIQELIEREPPLGLTPVSQDVVTRFAHILARASPVQQTETGPAFAFPDHLPGSDDVMLMTEARASLLDPHLRAWLPDVPLAQPIFVALEDNHAAAICASVRLTNAAYEAGVETAPAFRGRGHAPRVVAAWACAVRALDREPLYSTSWRNTASRAVARKLGLIQFGSDLHIT